MADPNPAQLSLPTEGQSSQAQPAAAAASSSPQATGGTETKGTRPSWLPETHWDATTGAIKDSFGTHYNEIVAARAVDESKRLSRPQRVEDFKPDLPADFKVPEGLEFKLNLDDPLIGQYRALALEAGLDQATFSKGLGLLAAVRVSETQAIKAARDAEIAKLGANASSRVDAVTTFMNAKFGEKHAAAWNQMMLTAAHVELGEAILALFQNQGMATFNASGRQAPAPQTPSDEAWAKMSYSERMDYARAAQARTNGAAAR